MTEEYLDIGGALDKDMKKIKCPSKAPSFQALSRLP
jgi:hypothetical protein